MKKSRFLTGWILIVALFFTSVMPMNVSAQAQAATKPELNKKKVSLYIGQRSKLTVSNAGNKKIVWSTSNKKIAKVSQKGSVLAVKAGTATIKATVKGTKKTASCKVVVGKYAAKLTISGAENVILKEGETTEIKAGVSPAKVLKKGVTYESANPEIAAVDDNGKITAVKQGLTEITVKTKSRSKNGKKLTKIISVYVQPADEESENTENKTDNSNSNNNSSNNNGNTSAADSPIAEKIISGNTQIYVLDKNYSDQMTATITVNGKTWNSAGTVESVLDDLENTWATKENGDKTIQVNKEMGGEWWTVTDLTTQEVLFRVKAESDYQGNSEYGQIIVEEVTGDVTVLVR